MNGKKLQSKNCEPVNEGNRMKTSNVDLFIVEREIKKQLLDTEDTSVVENVDITTLAPKKVIL